MFTYFVIGLGLTILYVVLELFVFKFNEYDPSDTGLIAAMIFFLWPAAFPIGAFALVAYGIASLAERMY